MGRIFSTFDERSGSNILFCVQNFPQIKALVESF